MASLQMSIWYVLIYYNMYVGVSLWFVLQIFDYFHILFRDMICNLCCQFFVLLRFYIVLFMLANEHSQLDQWSIAMECLI